MERSGSSLHAEPFSYPTTLIHAGFILTGMVTTLLGPILPTLSSKWSLDDLRAGYLFTAQFLGSIYGCGGIERSDSAPGSSILVGSRVWADGWRGRRARLEQLGDRPDFDLPLRCRPWFDNSCHQPVGCGSKPRAARRGAQSIKPGLGHWSRSIFFCDGLASKDQEHLGVVVGTRGGPGVYVRVLGSGFLWQSCG